MEFLLLNSHREENVEDENDAAGEDRIFVEEFTDPNLGEVSISAILLKREILGSLKPQNPTTEYPIRSMVKSKTNKVGDTYRRVAASPLKRIERSTLLMPADFPSPHNEIWKGDREHISNTLDGEHYLDLVTKTIRESDALKQLEAKKATEELERASKAESKPVLEGCRQ